MKVNAISAMSYGYGVNRASVKQNKAMSAPVSKDLLDYPKGYMPYQINFAGSGGYAKLPGIKLLKTVQDLPCLYCAQRMVQSGVIDGLSAQNSKIARSMGELAKTIQKHAERFQGLGIVDDIVKNAQKNPAANSEEYIKTLEAFGKKVPQSIKDLVTRQMTGVEYAKHAINTVSKYEDALLPTERNVFGMIKSSYEKNPNQTISQIMSGLRKSKLAGLEESQLKIINEIEEMAKQTLSKQTREKVLFETQKAKSLLTTTNSDYPFKRKKFIEILNCIPYKNDGEAMEKILAKADSIPTSGTNTSAFIAKYTNNGGRSDAEIIQRLLDPSRQSVEHIRPQMTFKTSGGSYTGPKDVIQNLALAHKQCNSDRGHMTLEEYMRMNPKAKESIQKHVDFLINEIKAGRLKSLEHYPDQLKETFSKETDGRLVLDTSAIREYLEKFLTKKAS